MESFEQEQAPAIISESEEKSVLQKRITELEEALLDEQKKSAEVISYFQKQLERLGIDPLTDVNNRLSFDQELDRSFKIIRGEITEHRADAELLKEISMIFIDLDHFKEVNDSLGHLAGDEVLKKVARLLKDELRDGDMLARYGGDEFVVLLSDTNENGAAVAAEKLRTAIDNDSELKDLGVTASFGVCWTDSSNATDLKTFIDNADKAAYEAKHKGRNRVEIHHEENEI